MTNENIYGSAAEIPILANAILEKAAVMFLDILRKVCKKCKRRHTCVGKLGAILNLYILALGCRGRRFLDNGKQNIVKLRSRNFGGSAHLHVLCCFKHLEYALFRHCRSKNYGEIHKRSHARANGVDVFRLRLLGFILYQIPFVHHHNKSR